MATLSFQPLKVHTGGPDKDGLLVFADGSLVALIVRLSALHDDLEGCWHLELLSGLTASPLKGVFRNLDDASAWIGSHLRPGLSS